MRTLLVGVVAAIAAAVVYGWTLFFHPALQIPQIFVPGSDLIGQLIEETAKREQKTEENKAISSVNDDIAALIAPHCGGSEHLWLACALYFEARGESEFGQYLVGQVILNRVADRRWPKTIEAVVRQGETRLNGCQFSFRCDGKPKHIAELGAWAVALKVAAEAIADYTAGKKVTCAHSYHADYVTSKRALAWFATLSAERQEGVHIFFCDKQREGNNS